MKKSLMKSISISLAGLLGLAGMIGITFSPKKEAKEVSAAGTVLVKVDEACVTGEQIAGGNAAWRAGTNATITSTTISGKKYARLSRTTTGSTTSSKEARLIYSGSDTLWHKCIMTYTVDNISESYMFAFGNLANKNLTKGTLQTVEFDYTGEYQKELVNNSTYFKFYCANTSAVLNIYSWDFYVLISEGTVKIAAGTGVKEAFVSSNASATSGSTSQKFNIDTKVYGFVKLKAGYSMPSGWTLVSGTKGAENAIYRNNGYTLDKAEYDFGTINASLEQFAINWNLDGGSATGLPSSYTMVSGFSTSVEPTKRGYRFLGWTGSNGSTPQKTITVSAGATGAKEYSANWEIINYSISYDLKGGSVSNNPTTYNVNTPTFTLNNPSRLGSEFTGWTGTGLGSKQLNLSINPSDLGFTLEDKTFTANYQYSSDIQEVVDLINAIGGPSNVQYYSSYSAINAAQSAYDALIQLHPEYEGIIYEYDELLADWEAYNALKDAAIANVQSLIAAIGQVSYPSSKGAINAARDAYDGLNEVDKNSVSNLSVLTNAESDYASLRTAAIANAESLIAAIGSVSYPGSKEAIDSARSAFDGLDNADKLEVTNKDDLPDLESDYSDLRLAAISNVESLIAAIGSVSYPGSKEAIDAAKDAYNALHESDKSDVTNEQTLLDAETEYNALKLAGVSNVEGLINAIGEVTLLSGPSISDARSGYDALTNEQKALVSNYQTLVDDEALFASLQRIKHVIDLIDDLPTFEYTQAFKTLLDEAKEAYDALNNEEQPQVTNVDKLNQYIKQYNDITAASNVIALIDSIGDVEDSAECSGKINAAREAYDALSADQKALIESNKVNTLVNAESTYKDLHDHNQANSVISLIDAIGTLEYSDQCKAKIDEAKEAYEALTEDQKALVNNSDTLSRDEQVYYHVKEVVDKIEGIGEVGYNDESKDNIEGARSAYDELSEEEKALFPQNKLEKLTKAEEVYAELEQKANKSLSGWGVALIVIGSILLVLCGAYLLLLFVFNKWIKQDDKVLRVLRFSLGNKDGKKRLFVFPCKFVYREENEIYKNKEDALK